MFEQVLDYSYDKIIKSESDQHPVLFLKLLGTKKDAVKNLQKSCLKSTTFLHFSSSKTQFCPHLPTVAVLALCLIRGHLTPQLYLFMKDMFYHKPLSNPHWQEIS